MINPEYPILVGLAGEAGTGKTVTAQGLLTPPRLEVEGEEHEKEPLVWGHLFFALPIYRIATVKQKIKGQDAKDRILFEIHEGLLDIFGRSPIYSPIKSYDKFTWLVHYIAAMQCEPEGQKARTFMQKFGSICREYDIDVFANWLKRKSLSEFHQMREEYPDQYPAIAISDLRYPNEAEMVMNQPNGMVIRLTASPEVLRERLLRRDGVELTPEQAQHESETSLKLIQDVDATVDSTGMSVREQVAAVREVINKHFYL